MTKNRVISSDNHVFEPSDLWTSRIDSKFRERAPHVVAMDDGGHWWVCDGIKSIGFAGASQVGRRFEEPEKLTNITSSEDVRPGGYIPEEHVKDMESDGVEVSLVYPTVSLVLYRTVTDTNLLTSIASAYNDWLAEFCKPLPSRLKGIAMLNVDDVGIGIKEMERCANMGLAGAMITVYPREEKAYDLPEYEPLWAAAQDLGLPLTLHSLTNRPGPGMATSFDTVSPAYVCNMDHWVRMSIARMIFSGVFERYPKLHVGSVEMELSWAPHFLDRLDYTYTQRPPTMLPYRYKEDMLPSDYFHRNVFLGFQEDGLGIRDREIIGVNNLLWGSDYPHPESTFPKSQEIIQQILAECTEEEKAKIVGGNAARIYNLY